MPQKGLIVRALIASPGDVQQERLAIPEVIAAWNATHSYARAVVIEPVKWESHSVPGLEGRPQGMINKQLVAICDFLIGVFWTRLGTHTGVAPSGTAEEIDEFRKAGKPVLLYFSSRPVDLESIDTAQYEALKAYQKKLEPEGLIQRYQDVGQLREMLARHINSIIETLIDSAPKSSDAASEVEDDDESQVALFIEQLETFLRRFSAKWTAEKESKPLNLDESVYILRNAADEIIQFVSFVQKDTANTIKGPLQDFARRLKVLIKHSELVFDEAEADDFWKQGDTIILEFERYLVGVRSATTE